MQQQISVITLSVADLARSRRFYTQGFGWTPVFSNDEISFYQMNGFILGTWSAQALTHDIGETAPRPSGGFTIAHNVASHDAVEPLMAQLVKAGGRIARAAIEPPHGGYTGYVADPDGHMWEIAFNPAWPISPEGYVTFAS